MEIKKSISELEESIRVLREEISKEENKEEKAKLFIELGNNYLLLSEREDPRDNLVNALVAFGEAEKLSNSVFVMENVENMKGFLFFKLAFIEDRNYNLKKAIEHYKNALKYRTRETKPYQYASLRYNLGNAYLSLRDGNERNNILRAIEEFNEAYKIRSKQKNSLEFGVISNALGLSYLMLSEIANDPKEAATYLSEALSYFAESADVFTKEEYPVDYAMIHNNLGVCFTRLALLGKDRKKNFEEGIEHYKKSLEVYTENDFPDDFGTTMYNIGIAYHNLSKIVPMPYKGEYLKNAEKHLKSSADVFTGTEKTDSFSRSNYNLGAVYKDLAEIFKKKEFLEKELEAFKNALEGFDDEKTPFAYATTHFYIAQVYYSSGKKNEALDHYREAKRIAEKFDKKLATDLENIIKQIEAL